MGAEKEKAERRPVRGSDPEVGGWGWGPTGSQVQLHAGPRSPSMHLLFDYPVLLPCSSRGHMQDAGTRQGSWNLWLGLVPSPVPARVCEALKSS